MGKLGKLRPLRVDDCYARTMVIGPDKKGLEKECDDACGLPTPCLACDQHGPGRREIDGSTLLDDEDMRSTGAKFFHAIAIQAPVDSHVLNGECYRVERNVDVRLCNGKAPEAFGEACADARRNTRDIFDPRGSNSDNNLI